MIDLALHAGTESQWRQAHVAGSEQFPQILDPPMEYDVGVGRAAAGAVFESLTNQVQSAVRKTVQYAGQDVGQQPGDAVGIGWVLGSPHEHQVCPTPGARGA